MDWKRIKNILIVLLAATNVILAVSVYSQFSARNRAEKQAVRAALELVSDTFFVSENEILALPREIYSLRVTRINTAEDAFAQKLLGGEFTSESGGGGIYRYTGQNGSGEIKRGGEIEFELTNVKGEATLAEHYNTLLKDAGLTLDGAGRQTESSVRFEQYYSGYPVLDYSLECTGTGVSGRWLISDSWVRQSVAPARAELVIRLAAVAAERGLQSVGEIRCAYYIENTGGQDSFALPVWIVKANGTSFVFDIVNMKVIE